MSIGALHCRMLEQLVINRTLSSTDLLAMYEGSADRVCYATIEKLAEKEYIRQSLHTITGSTGKRKSTYQYVITPKGLRYLIAKAKEDVGVDIDHANTTLPWIGFIRPEDTKNISILSDISGTTDAKQAIAEAAFLSELAGATVPVFVHDPSSPITDVSETIISDEMAYRLDKELETAGVGLRQLEKRKETKRKNDARINAHRDTLGDITEYAIASWMMKETERKPNRRYMLDNLCYKYGELLDGYDRDDDDYIRYVHPRTVKYVAMMSDQAEMTDTADTKRGRYAGLLQSRFRTLLLFDTRAPELNWPQSIGDAERDADKAWKDTLRDEFREQSVAEGTCGALLVTSPASLQKLWKDQLKLIKKQSEWGYYYNHLYLIEISNIGTDSLYEIMVNTTVDYLESEKERILCDDFAESINSRFEINTGGYREIFPLRCRIDGEAYQFAIGTWVDIRKVQRILRAEETEKKHGETLRFGIVCLPWQEPYYRVMLPHSVIYWDGKEKESVMKEAHKENTAEKPVGDADDGSLTNTEKEG